MNIQSLTCPNCAGSINRATMICEYCGTRFQFPNDVNPNQILRIEHQSSPVRVCKMETAIPDELLRDSCLAKESIVDYAMGNIRDQLAKALEECMEIEMHYDIREMRQVITAKVRVLEPNYRF